MKTLLLSLALIASVTALPGFAADAPAARGGHLRARLLHRFDADKDGKLSDSERTAAREAIRTRLPEIMKRVREKFDANGDGRLDESERGKARESLKGPVGGAIRRHVLERFDEDHDGKLSDTEREKARTARETRQAEKK